MWRFREMSRGEENVDPVQGEFFASQEIGDIGEVLVREAIQNSLDARRDQNSIPAELKITYGVSEKTLGDLEGMGGPFNGLVEHLVTNGNGLHPDIIDGIEVHSTAIIVDNDT